MTRPAEPDVARRRAYRFGLSAERVAALYLLAKGYRILARRYGGKGGEIDLIARRGRLVIFVEVKARGTLEAASDAITPRKRRFVEQAVRRWLSANPWSTGYSLRFDAVYVRRLRLPVHAADVFSLTSV